MTDTNDAAKAAAENAKKRLEEDRKISDQSRAEYAERSKGKPTPTPEEIDLAILGGFVTGSEHEADGSGLVKIAMTPSPIAGATGNREFFIHLRRKSD